MQEPDTETLTNALRRVIDPEVGMNIVDLGLVYGVHLSDDGLTLTVDLTMTSPACPMSELIFDEVDAALRPLLHPDAMLDINLVWNPPWGPERMSEHARRHFGW